MPEIVLPFHFEPRQYQLPVWEAFDEGYKRMLLIWHRRAGKDKTCLNIMARATQERVGTYFYFLPTYAQGKKIVWDGMDFEGFRFLNHFPRDLWEGGGNSTEMKIRFKNGSLFQIVGSDNIDSIVGTNPVGVIFSEYTLQDPSGWDFIRPILRENKGWAIFNGTPRGRNNHLFHLFETAQDNKEWFTSRLTIEDTGVMTEEDIQAERDAGMDEELIQQEFYCSFDGGLSGAYYNKQMQDAYDEGRITDLAYDPTLPVDTWWDIGMHDSTAIAFTQTEPGTRTVRIIDYYETSGEGLAHYVKYLAGLPYIYGEHIGPFDLEVREMGTGKSRLEMAYELGLTFNIARKLPLEDGINAVRSMLPMVWFDKTKCRHLIDSLMSYHKMWDPKRREWKAKPEHDWSTHGADAMRCGSVGRRNAHIPERKKRYEVRYWKEKSGPGWMAA